MEDVAESERERWEWEDREVGVELVEPFVTDKENFQMKSEQTTVFVSYDKTRADNARLQSNLSYLTAAFVIQTFRQENRYITKTFFHTL